MKKMAGKFFLISLSLVFLGQAPAPGKTSVAIYPIRPSGAADKAVASALTSLLSAELTPSPRVSVIEEAMLKEVMERQALNISDACDDTACQVAIGKLVQARKMISGDLVKLGTRYILSLKLVDVQSGALDFSTKDECACSEEQVDKLVVVAGAKIHNHFGENIPIPSLPQAAGPPAPPPGAQAFLPAPVPAQKTFQEFQLPGAKGGPMVFVSDFKFYIDKFEVTNQDYQECVSAGVCKEPKKKNGFDAPQQPVVYVNQNDARSYCQWAGKRLPKEQEWQEAAQGTDGRTYPWGNQEPNCSLANYKGCASGTVSVGSKPAGASPYGALDMAGNVLEWVEENGVLRGGGWSGIAGFNIPATRLPGGPMLPLYGFRCARDGS